MIHFLGGIEGQPSAFVQAAKILLLFIFNHERHKKAYPHIQVFTVDFLKEMLEQARGKIERMGLSKRITMSRGDALNIPAPSDAFDGAAIAFGIRNIPDRVQALYPQSQGILLSG